MCLMGRLCVFCFFLDSSGTPFVPSALLRRTTFPDQSGKAFKLTARKARDKFMSVSESVMLSLLRQAAYGGES